MAHVYCAGPLFNPREREEMAAIASTLEEAGHTTFLPQRDGFEMRKVRRDFERGGVIPATAKIMTNEAIIALDMHQLLKCAEVVVANLNGRVPDEGAMIEVGASFALGMPIVLYKSDIRSFSDGADNPMVTGTTWLPIVREVQFIPSAVDRALKEKRDHLTRVLTLGERVADLLSKQLSSVQFMRELRQLLQ